MASTYAKSGNDLIAKDLIFILKKFTDSFKKYSLEKVSYNGAVNFEKCSVLKEKTNGTQRW